MLNTLLRTIVQLLLRLRYRVTLRGLQQIKQRGTRGILFLPNHPGLIDPIILVAALHRDFAPRAVADEQQMDRPFISWFGRRLGIIRIPDIQYHGAGVRNRFEVAWRQAADTLRRGGNMLLYPAGRIQRSRFENLRGNSGAADLMRQAPEARVVLVRTRGLWGSSLSLAGGEYPHIGQWLVRQSLNLLRSFIFFLPKRRVTIEFVEPDDLPSPDNRRAVNAYLEAFYNDAAPPARYVAYALGDRPPEREMPEPHWRRPQGALEDVPDSTRQQIYVRLREMSGEQSLHDEAHLAEDLGLDSLARADLLLWLDQEFGGVAQDGDTIVTVGDVLLAAQGEGVVTRLTALEGPPPRWFREKQRSRLQVAPGETIAEAFLNAARRQPDRLIVADQMRGPQSYRDLITALLVLRPEVAALEGAHVGLMLPASVGATIVYLAAVFADKTPVMINWTTGARSMRHTLEIVGARHVLTSKVLVQRLTGMGVDFSSIKDRFVFLEDIGPRISKRRKLWAMLRSYLSWRELRTAPISDTAVVLMTSGSEALPKAVPLTHRNILTNTRDVLQVVQIFSDDRLMGFLPPFHSFGLTVTLVLPLVIGARTVYHPSPTEAFMITRLIRAYRATVVMGTPAFLGGILRAAPDPAFLASLRIVVTGAEKCPPRVYDLFARQAPQATVLEGYGITECSPIVSANRVENPQPGTIGQVLPSLEYVILDVDTDEPVEPGRSGMLLVRGPSIFHGYLGDREPPFVEHAGRQWYRTGDLISEDEAHVLTFRGRLKRFVKRGGEMISLPAVEAALAPHYTADGDEGPTIAVVPTPHEEKPELVLFTTKDVARERVNEQIRAAGLSPLHNIARVERVNEIPLLGNGKTDYRTLEGRLKDKAGQ